MRSAYSTGQKLAQLAKQIWKSKGGKRKSPFTYAAAVVPVALKASTCHPAIHDQGLAEGEDRVRVEWEAPTPVRLASGSSRNCLFMVSTHRSLGHSVAGLAHEIGSGTALETGSNLDFFRSFSFGWFLSSYYLDIGCFFHVHDTLLLEGRAGKRYRTIPRTNGDVVKIANPRKKR